MDFMDFSHSSSFSNRNRDAQVFGIKFPSNFSWPILYLGKVFDDFLAVCSQPFPQNYGDSPNEQIALGPHWLVVVLPTGQNSLIAMQVVCKRVLTHSEILTQKPNFLSS